MTDQLRDLVYLNWTIRGPRFDADGEAFVIVIDELPGFVAAGETAEEATTEFLPALANYLAAMVENGMAIPEPAGHAGWTPQPVQFRRPKISRVEFAPIPVPA